MKNEKLLDAIGKIDDELIDDAIRNTKKKKKSGWLKWGVVAACAAFVVYAGVQSLPMGKTPTGGADGYGDLMPEGEEGPAGDQDALEGGNPVRDAGVSELPMLTVSDSMRIGTEGYYVYDISELVNANPWSEDAALQTLPVYQNPLSYGDFNVSGADFNAMKEFLLDVAERLGMDTRHLEVTDDTPDEAYRAAIYEKADGDVPEEYFNPTRVIAEENGIRIEVDTEMTATITFEPTRPLPDNYHFAYHASYEDIAAVAGYLKETYQDLIGMEHPQTNIFGGDYNIKFRQSYDIGFFEADGDVTEQIINYNFNQVEFSCDDNKELWLIRIFQPDLSNKAGDYPLISVEEATDLLLDGNYMSSSMGEMGGREKIAKVDLVYRFGGGEEYYIPYYRFYVEEEISEKSVMKQQDQDIKSYVAYYVPAVEGQYITNMPVDGDVPSVKG